MNLKIVSLAWIHVNSFLDHHENMHEYHKIASENSHMNSWYFTQEFLLELMILNFWIPGWIPDCSCMSSWIACSMFAWNPWWFLNANDTSVFSSSTSVTTTLLFSAHDEELPSPVDASKSSFHVGTVRASAPKHLWHLHGCVYQKNQDCWPLFTSGPVFPQRAGSRWCGMCVCMCGRTIGGTPQLKALTGFISKCPAGIKRSHALLVFV